ncbi:MAG: hypothetical protein IID42_00085 [Planctomycetes bacterium]|nr:hypothetical protein [Planctomycetota bacterium]
MTASIPPAQDPETSMPVKLQRVSVEECAKLLAKLIRDNPEVRQSSIRRAASNPFIKFKP